MFGDDVLVELGEVSAGVEAVGAVEEPGATLVHQDVPEASHHHTVKAGGVGCRNVGELMGVALGEMATVGALEVSRDTPAYFTTSLYDNRHPCKDSTEQVRTR